LSAAKASLITLATLILVMFAICYEFIRSEGLSARKKPRHFRICDCKSRFGPLDSDRRKDTKNPIRPTPDALTEARKYYSDNCAVCHGSDGSRKTEAAKGLSPEVLDLHAERVQMTLLFRDFSKRMCGLSLSPMISAPLRRSKAAVC
jgi:hypothetical protein